LRVYSYYTIGFKEFKLWNLSSRTNVGSVERAHRGFIRGLAINADGSILTCGDDKTIKLWTVSSPTWDVTPFADGNPSSSTSSPSVSLISQFQAPVGALSRSDSVFAGGVTQSKPAQTWLGKSVFTSLSHQNPHTNACYFATTSAAACVDVWSYDRSEPVSSMKWSAGGGEESLTSCSFNPIERDIVAATSQSDRSILFYDLRSSQPIRKLVLAMNSNVVAWNPMEAFNFTVGNEDHNCYTFDMRKLNIALNVHVDHVGAVLDIDYSPTGREFVSGSYDRTVRIFSVDKGRSREVYHTKRMQRVFSVKYSADSSFVISGSDDANIRLWKSDASQPLNILVPRQMQKREYEQQLVHRYRNLPEIRRIETKRHVPKVIHQTQQLKRVMKNSRRRKLLNVKAHSAPGSVTVEAERRKSIIKEST
jgi:DDB1- and CUL4-associated factor 13